jgi:hypothetical protein
MANRQAETVALTGLAATYHPADAAGDTVPVGDHVHLHVKNGSTAAATATITTPGTVSGLAISDLAVSVPAGGDRFIGPLRRDLFAGAGGVASVAWSATASVTFAVLRG